MEYTYYEVRLYEDRRDRHGIFPYQGQVKRLSALVFDGDDKSMSFNVEVEDESLAIQILIQNLKSVKLTHIWSSDPDETAIPGQVKEILQNEADLKVLIEGKFEKATVIKYKSDYLVQR